MVKEKVKCRDCGKEGEIENTLVQKDFFIHWDKNDKEYFLCSGCEPAPIDEEEGGPDF